MHVVYELSEEFYIIGMQEPSVQHMDSFWNLSWI